MDNCTLKVYCSACNSPNHSRTTATKGVQAQAGLTVAVSQQLFKRYKGKRIHLKIYDDEGKIMSEHLPYIHDNHNNSNNIIDLYIGERDNCDCKNHIWSNKSCSFTFI